MNLKIDRDTGSCKIRSIDDLLSYLTVLSKGVPMWTSLTLLKYTKTCTSMKLKEKWLYNKCLIKSKFRFKKQLLLTITAS